MTEMDRMAPTRRPEERPVGWQSWRDLLFLHWPVAHEALRPFVPGRLSIDLWDGTAYVGVVAFAMEAVRQRPMHRIFALDLLETNVRTYVHLEGQAPGVHFFSLDAESLLAVLGARIFFGLPYFPARMRLERRDGEIVYRTRRRWGAGPELEARYRTGRELGPARFGTLEHWLVERYLLYVERRGRLYRGQVHHPPYGLREVELLGVRDALIGAAGLPQPEGRPTLVHASAGVDVEIFGLKRC
jgi:uncharacterized protein